MAFSLPPVSPDTGDSTPLVSSSNPSSSSRSIIPGRLGKAIQRYRNGSQESRLGSKEELGDRPDTAEKIRQQRERYFNSQNPN